MRPVAAPLLQFLHPVRAHGVFLSPGGAWALASSALGILLGVYAAGSLGAARSWELAVFVLVERAVLSGLAGVAAWGLARAAGEKVTLLPAMEALFMAMVVWVFTVTALLAINRVTGLPMGFSWGLGEGARYLPATPPGRFLHALSLGVDIPSVATVWVWGRGLRSVWRTGSRLGERTAWAVYMTALVLQAASVLLIPESMEVF